MEAAVPGLAASLHLYVLGHGQQRNTPVEQQPWQVVTILTAGQCAGVTVCFPGLAEEGLGLLPHIRLAGTLLTAQLRMLH